MVDPFTSFAAGINSSLRLFEVTYQLKAVDEQTADLLETTRHVDSNINEARRLRRVKEQLINHGERTWIDGVIDDTDSALRAVAQLIEPARVDKTTKSEINFGNRFMWVFRDNPKVRDKHARLSMCHQSLTAVIACLYSKDVVIMTPVSGEKKEETPPPYDPQMEALLNWRNRRRRGKSMMNPTEPIAQRPMPAGSESTSTTVTSPMSVSLHPMDAADDISALASTQSTDATYVDWFSPSTDPTERAMERPMSANSDPTGNAVISPMASFAGLLGEAEGRPMSASTSSSNKNVGAASTQIPQNDVNEWEFRWPYPMSPSDYSTKPETEPIAEPFNDSADRSSTDVFNSLSALAETDSRYAVAKPSDRSYEGADGLQFLPDQIQSVYHPYRPSSFFVSSSPPPSSSAPASPPTQGYGAEQTDTYDPPRFPTSSAHSHSHSAVGLGTFDFETYDENQEHEANRQLSLATKKEALAQEPPRSPGAAQGRVRRGGRSWLVFHANRSDVRHEP